MRVLIVNDDGIESLGLLALAQALSKEAAIDIVAPAHEKSGAGSSISAYAPIKYRKHYIDGNFYGHVIDGTPVDCVRIGLSKLVLKPDFVFAGINPGLNISPHIYHSGTVSAATEALMAGYTATAVSVQTDDKGAVDFSPAAEIALYWLKLLKNNKLPSNTVYNLSIPALPIKGIVPAPLSSNPSILDYRLSKNPMGEEYFWIGESYEENPPTGSDLYMVRQGYAVVTPLCANRLDKQVFQMLGEFL